MPAQNVVETRRACARRVLQPAVFDFFELLVERAAADSQEFAGLAFVPAALGEDGFDVAKFGVGEVCVGSVGGLWCDGCG